MSPRDFAYWLQGLFELGGEVKELNKNQVQLIKDHLELVFKHEAGVTGPVEPVPGGNHEWQRIPDNPKPLPNVPNIWPNPYPNWPWDRGTLPYDPGRMIVTC